MDKKIRIDNVLIKRLNGANWKVARLDSGVGHVRAEYEEMRFQALLAAADESLPREWLPIDVTGWDDAKIGRETRKLRAVTTDGKSTGKGQSWGRIAARMGLPESRVRRCFKAVSNVEDRGLRVAHGGRFVNDDGSLYSEDPEHGVAIVKADEEVDA